jgi:hypothetical protein
MMFLIVLNSLSIQEIIGWATAVTAILTLILTIIKFWRTIIRYWKRISQLNRTKIIFSVLTILSWIGLVGFFIGYHIPKLENQRLNELNKRPNSGYAKIDSLEKLVIDKQTKLDSLIKIIAEPQEQVIEDRITSLKETINRKDVTIIELQEKIKKFENRQYTITINTLEEYIERIYPVKNALELEGFQVEGPFPFVITPPNVCKYFQSDETKANDVVEIIKKFYKDLNFLDSPSEEELVK